MDAHDLRDAKVKIKDESIDAIFSSAALHWMKADPKKVLEGTYRVLKSGGRFAGEVSRIFPLSSLERWYLLELSVQSILADLLISMSSRTDGTAFFRWEVSSTLEGFEEFCIPSFVDEDTIPLRSILGSSRLLSIIKNFSKE